jgi:hypothetical protein
LTAAVAQLANDDVAVRVGGIYALGRIAEESVTAYVRKHSPWPPEPNSPFPADYPLDQLPPCRSARLTSRPS